MRLYPESHAGNAPVPSHGGVPRRRARVRGRVDRARGAAVPGRDAPAVGRRARRRPGLAALYAESAIRSSDEGAKARSSRQRSSARDGRRAYYIGASLFPGQRFGLTRLPRSASATSLRATSRSWSSSRHRESRRLIAAAQPVQLAQGTEPFGWLIVAKPEAELREQWVTLLGRLALALAVGVALAGLLSLALAASHRARPCAHARPSRSPRVATTSRSRNAVATSRTAERRPGMVAKLAEAEKLKRRSSCRCRTSSGTPLTAIRGHVEAIREGVERARAGSHVTRDRRRRDRPARDRRRARPRQAPGRFTVRHEEVDLERVLDQAYGAFTEEHAARSTTRCRGRRPRPSSCRTEIVLQVITNLLSNVSVDPGRPHRAAAGAANGVVSVDVVDSGPGVPPSHALEDLRGVRLQDAEGTGLGLRSLASSRSHSAAGSSWSNSGAGSASDSCCRCHRRSRSASRGQAAAVRELARVGACASGSTAGSGSPRGACSRRSRRHRRPPARADEVDEECEIVDTCMALCEEVALQPLEAANRLVQESADLGDVSSNR